MSNWLTSPVAPWWVNVLERIFIFVAGTWPVFSHFQHRDTNKKVDKIEKAMSNGHGNSKDQA